MDLLMMNMIQQQQQQLRVPVTPGVTAVPVPVVLSAPQSPVKFQLPDISLAAFCQRYNISSMDQERLEKLEFLPGDKIDKLPEVDWKTHAGFTALSWQQIVDKNRSFERDARNGLWL